MFALHCQRNDACVMAGMRRSRPTLMAAQGSVKESVKRAWDSGWGLWLKRWLVIVLVPLLLVACGGRPPTEVVAAALNYKLTSYELTNKDHSPPPLVGQELLHRWTTIQEIKVRGDRPLPLVTTWGDNPEPDELLGHDLEGTYTLVVRSPVNKTSHLYSQERFQLTLAQLPTADGKPNQWAIAYPQPDSSPSAWDLVLLPAGSGENLPPLPPEQFPDEPEDLPDPDPQKTETASLDPDCPPVTVSP